MVTPEQIQQAISRVNDQTSFIQGLLYDTLQWPVDGGIEKVEDISFAWTAQELRAEGLDRHIVDGQVWQIQPLREKQPWAVFLLEFNNVNAFIKGRGLTGPLRKVLRGLVSRRRKANLPLWQRENLLFVCTHQYQYFRFGYFKAPKETKTAPLITFGWGPDTPARTACEFNLPALAWPQDPDNLDAWQEQWMRAFDKEKLTEDFFRTFTKLYHKVVDDIAKIRGLEDEAGKLAHLLLDRMLFLYFIQKKDWLDQKADYLYSLFLERWDKDSDGHSYYSSVLYPLFLCLSNPNASIDKMGAVPFLNGGLFEETSIQSQTEQINHARLQVKNSTFKLIFNNLLERFNFTVTEDTPLDVEVAIDPEMLGKIFESLILELEREPGKDLRKLTGSYYTPRPIVHFMCEEAIKEHLVTQLVGSGNTDSKETHEKVGTLLGLPQADQMDHEQVEILKGLFMPAEAKILRQAILDCRVCDPAVGSGAFLVGMLHEMIAAIARLDLCIHGRRMLTQHNYYYDLKKKIIESCLYGVDIQEQAVRLCELRLWLSLIVDYQINPDKPFVEAIREVPSLPNLSYRIMRGDSLLERLFGHVVQLDTISKDARTKQLIESIQADKQAYFREGSNIEKRRLELKILTKQADLAERLIEAKKAAAGVQADFWGKEAIDVKARKEKAKQEARSAELEELKEKVAVAKAQLERLLSQKGSVNRGDLDTLRRQYFHTGDAPTFIWCVDFAEVFEEKGGFDIVIANPPYVEGRRSSTKELPILKKLYHSAQGKVNLFNVFQERGYQIAKEFGLSIFIIPSPFLRNSRYWSIRKFLLENARIIEIIEFVDMQFEASVVENIIILAQKTKSIDNNVLVFNNVFRHNPKMFTQGDFLLQKHFRILTAATSEDLRTIQKLKRQCVPLEEICEIKDGISTGFKPFPEILLGQKVGDYFISLSGNKEEFNTQIHKKVIGGGEFNKYSSIHWEGRYIKYDKSIEQDPKPPKGHPFNCQLRDTQT